MVAVAEPAMTPSTPRTPGAWLGPIERLVVHAAREVRLLAALTPIDAHVERARLVRAVAGKRPAVPRWTYAPRAHEELLHALGAAAAMLRNGDETPLETLYLARIRELTVEAALCAAAGTKKVGPLARERFAPDPRSARAASDMARAWLDEPVVTARGLVLLSDDADPRSLLSQMRAAVGSLRLPFSVVVQPSLAPLAATGEHVVLVASARPVHDDDARRTVLHEIEGHAQPRARSQRSTLAILRAGTARGIDDQEGRALLLEERAGFLGSRRKRQLAARHRAVEAMLEGASFTEVALALVDEHGLEAQEAVVVAERVFRGSDGSHPGLGRERVYLESFVLVRNHLEAHPDDEAVLASGQIAVDAIEPLRPFSPGAPAP
jgi:hypothetical protein